MLRRAYIILFLFLLNNFVVALAQTNASISQPATDSIVEEVVIKKGDVLTLKQQPPRIKSLIIKGTLIIDDQVDIDLYVEQLLIDGGILQAGSVKKAFSKKLSILFTAKDSLQMAGLKVINQGSLLLYGAVSKETVSAKETYNLSPRELYRNITIRTATTKDQGLISLENAGNIKLSDVAIHGLGIKNESPALYWYGTTKCPGFINNSVFKDSKGTDVVLDHTSAALEHNTFISGKGHSILCSPRGSGTDNDIEANTIINTNTEGFAAIAVINPYQTITNNVITTSEAYGIYIGLPRGKQQQKLAAKGASFVLRGNKVQRNLGSNTNRKDSSAIGIYIADINHTDIWRSEDNSIHNFDIGLRIDAKNVVVSNYELKNNNWGILPGSSYIQNSTIYLDNNSHQDTAKGMYITDDHGRSNPKISNITIQNYPKGIAFEGKIGPTNYFEKIHFKNTDPIYFSNFDNVGYILDKDGSLSNTMPLKKGTKQEHGGHDHHHMHSQKKEKVGSVIFAENSNLRTVKSQPLEGNSSMYTLPKTSIGMLTVSTGFGLNDPIHEHNRTLGNLRVTNSFTKRSEEFEETGNRKEILLSTGNSYELNYEVQANPLFDLSFEWDAAPNTWIVLKVPYAHKDVYGMHSFGGLIKASNSLQQLQKSNKTTYYNDEENAIVYVKIYNRKHHDEIVLYSPHVITEVAVADTKIPVTMRTNWKKEQIKVSYAIPERTASKIELLDYYGNVVETLYEGITQNSKTEVFVDLKKFDVETDVYLYSLTIGNAVHRGPIHTY